MPLQIAMINLVAVQAEMALEHYLSEGTFQQKIFSLMEQATAALPEAPTLVAFPEIIGLPLILTLLSESVHHLYSGGCTLSMQSAPLMYIPGYLPAQVVILE
jgi:hypothetical protein